MNVYCRNIFEAEANRSFVVATINDPSEAEGIVRHLRRAGGIFVDSGVDASMVDDISCQFVLGLDGELYCELIVDPG